MEKVAGFLSCIEEAFSVGDDKSQLASTLETLIVGPTREKALKNTQSWATNCLIRLYHAQSTINEEVKLPEFV